MRYLCLIVFTLSLSGCAIFGEIGGKSEGACVKTARWQGEWYSEAGYPTWYGVFIPKDKFTNAHIWCEYFKNGEWHRGVDRARFRRKATYYKESDYLEEK